MCSIQSFCSRYWFNKALKKKNKTQKEKERERESDQYETENSLIIEIIKQRNETQ